MIIGVLCGAFSLRIIKPRGTPRHGGQPEKSRFRQFFCGNFQRVCPQSVKPAFLKGAEIVPVFLSQKFLHSFFVFQWQLHASPSISLDFFFVYDTKKCTKLQPCIPRNGIQNTLSRRFGQFLSLFPKRERPSESSAFLPFYRHSTENSSHLSRSFSLRTKKSTFFLLLFIFTKGTFSYKIIAEKTEVQKKKGALLWEKISGSRERSFIPYPQ